MASNTAGKISTGGKMVGGFIVDKAKEAKTVVGQKIDSNEKLSAATKSAKEKAGALGTAVSQGVSGLFNKFKKSNPSSEARPLNFEEAKLEEDNPD